MEKGNGVKKWVLIILEIIVSILFFVLFREITKTLNIFLDYTEYYLAILMFVTIFCYFENKYLLSLISYLFFTIIVMNFRIPLEKYNYNLTIDYLKLWIENIRENKIISLNIISNLLLFIPVFYLLKKVITNNLYSLLITFFLIIILELLQMITKRGIFDIADIILNTFGVLIALVAILIYEVNHEKRQRKEKII